jgi:hypothetical protein
MQIKGSCQCGAVKFSLNSPHPVPYQRCYCSICRKQQGGGGYAINLGADAESVEVTGREHIGIHHAHMHASGKRTTISGAERAFCRECATALWLFDSQWPELIHPFASAIDTELPVPPQTTHIMLAFKPGWVQPDIRDGDLSFDEYPEESIADYHKRHGLEA